MKIRFNTSPSTRWFLLPTISWYYSNTWYEEIDDICYDCNIFEISLYWLKLEWIDLSFTWRNKKGKIINEYISETSN